MSASQKPLSRNAQNCCNGFKFKIEDTAAITLDFCDRCSIQLNTEEGKLYRHLLLG